MFFSGLFLGVAARDADLIKNISIPGLVLYTLGTVGRFASYIVQQKAFAFLDDAVDTFNTSRQKASR
jgi:hypothetical protein